MRVNRKAEFCIVPVDPISTAFPPGYTHLHQDTVPPVGGDTLVRDMLLLSSLTILMFTLSTVGIRLCGLRQILSEVQEPSRRSQVRPPLLPFCFLVY